MPGPPVARAFTLSTAEDPDPDQHRRPPTPFAGSFAPRRPRTSSKGLGNKKATNATWSLLAEDDSNANPAGTLDCFKLTIAATNPKKKKAEGGGPGLAPRAPLAFLESGHVRSLQVVLDQAQEGRTRSAASSSPSLPARSRSRREAAAGDPDANPALGLAVQKARDALDAQGQHPARDRPRHRRGRRRRRDRAVTYEGYGPGGAAILVETLTDNRNRTGSEVRHAFEKHGGSLGEPNSVAWQFEKRGVILVDGERYGEDDLMAAIDAGAEDVAGDGDVLKVITAPSDLAAVRSALEESGVEIAVRRALDGAEEHGRGREGGEGAAAADGRTRGARRRGLGPRQLRRAREVLERAAAG